MRSLHGALGGRLLAVLALLLLPPLLAVGGTAGAADPQPFEQPMTGLLPVCPGNLFSFSGHHEVFGDVIDHNNFESNSAYGLEQNCAFQNMQVRGPDDGPGPDPNNWARAMDGVAEPNVVPINDDPVTVTFRATPVTATGDFNLVAPPCLPVSTRPGGCVNQGGDPTLYVAYRLADGAGTFHGTWSLAGDAPNPYFDFSSPDCPDQYPGWDSNYQHTGFPCSYQLNFATNESGAPVLNDAMQLAVSLDWSTGTHTANGHTGPRYGYTVVIPMLFTPGGSTQLTLGSLPSSVPHGSNVTLSADAVGPAAGTTVNFFRKAPGGAVTLVGQDATDAGGEASVVATATGNAEYYASLTSPALDSNKRTLGVTRVLTMKKIKKLDGRKVKITGVVDPGSAGKIRLQLKGKKGWKTKKTVDAQGTVTWTLKAPKGKSTWRIVSVDTADFLESVSKSKSVTVPDG